MKLNTFFDTATFAPGQIYALKGNGSYFSHGHYDNCARAKLAILRSYMQSLNTDVLGVMLFGCAVKMPTSVTIRRKKWLIFGPIIESVVEQYVKKVYDFDFVIFTKDSQIPISMNVPGIVLDGVSFFAQVSSGLRMMCLTPEEYQAGLDAEHTGVTSLRDNGVMIMCNSDFALSNIGNPLLKACWELDTDGKWDCRIKIKE